MFIVVSLKMLLLTQAQTIVYHTTHIGVNAVKDTVVAVETSNSGVRSIKTSLNTVQPDKKLGKTR